MAVGYSLYCFGLLGSIWFVIKEMLSLSILLGVDHFLYLSGVVSDRRQKWSENENLYSDGSLQ